LADEELEVELCPAPVAFLHLDVKSAGAQLPRDQARVHAERYLDEGMPVGGAREAGAGNDLGKRQHRVVEAAGQ